VTDARRRSRLLALVVVVLLAACGPGAASVQPPIADVDPLAAAVLAEYGHRPTGATTRLDTVVSVAENGWPLYLEVSREVGLDFAPLAGRQGVLLKTPIEGSAPDAALLVLVVEGRPAGAWISPGGTSSGVLPVTAEP
jgi:hypothetical protein